MVACLVGRRRWRRRQQRQHQHRCGRTFCLVKVDVFIFLVKNQKKSVNILTLLLRLFGVCECVCSVVATWTAASFAWSIESKEREWKIKIEREKATKKTVRKWSDSASNNESHELSRDKVREEEQWVSQCNSTHDMFSDDNTKMDRRTYHLLSPSSSSPVLVTSPVFAQWKEMS